MKKVSLFLVWELLLLVRCFSHAALAEVQWDFKKPQELESEAIIKKEAGQSLSQETVQIQRPKVEYKAQGLKDPFLPVVIENKAEASAAKLEQLKPLPPMVVQGLIWGGEFPQAIVDNKVVRIGDSLGEVEITGISKDGVTVLYGDSEYNLSSPAAKGQQPQAKAGAQKQVGALAQAMGK